MVAVAAQVCPEAFVPCAIDVLWLSSTALTVFPLVTVAVPMSIPNSFHAKFPSAVPKVAANVHTFDGVVTVQVWNQRLAEPAAAPRSVSPMAAEPAPLPAPTRQVVVSILLPVPRLTSAAIRPRPAVVSRFRSTCPTS
jgi:hypothetical protein